MAGFRFPLLLAIPTILIGLFLNRSPFMMTSSAPSKPWADGPMKLIETPQYKTKKVNCPRREVRGANG
jgi:hypothetical protein